jgi:predicted ArsR family transcriptional regulator
MVREHDGALDAVELASQLGLHVTTVRFHLDALCDEELVARTRLNLPGRGRPRTGYVAVEEHLDYRVLAEVLAMELGQTVETRAQRAQRAGQKWAARLAGTRAVTDRVEEKPDAESDDDLLDRAASRATEAFTRMGFAPELATAAAPTTANPVRERVIRLHACPVRELARAHPEVGCAVHRGLLNGLLSQTVAEGGPSKTARKAMSAHLEPFVEPELCVARLVAG